MLPNPTSSSSSTHVFGFLGGTIYGPPELMPENMKSRFRPMNSEELLIYKNQVENSKGFDVDCKGCLSGRIYQILPTTSEWGLAELAAKYATAKIPGTPFKFKDLLKANYQVVGGVMYYVTFAVINKLDKVETLQRAKVWAKVDASLELKFSEIVTDKTAEDLRRELVKFCSTYVKPDSVSRDSRPRRPRSKSNNYVMRVNCLKPRELSLNGFNIFAKEMQMKNNGWKYARARRVASKKWKSFTLANKRPYFTKAQIKFGEKNFREC